MNRCESEWLRIESISFMPAVVGWANFDPAIKCAHRKINSLKWIHARHYLLMHSRLKQIICVIFVFLCRVKCLGCLIETKINLYLPPRIRLFLTMTQHCVSCNVDGIPCDVEPDVLQSKRNGIKMNIRSHSPQRGPNGNRLTDWTCHRLRHPIPKMNSKTH